MKKVLLLLFTGFTPWFIHAQHYAHVGSWSRLALNAKLTPKLGVTAEVGMRRQNSLIHLNPIEKPQTNNVKLTLAYSLKRLNLILSPVENIYSEALLGKESDLNTPRVHEFRVSGGVEYLKPVAKRRFQVRSIYEYRNFDGFKRGRVRTRVMNRWTISPANTLTLYDEFFVNTHPHPQPNWFNQNRMSCTYTRSLTRFLDLELGYIYVLSERSTLSEFDHTHALITYLTVKI